MRIGLSIFLVAVGAILRYALEADVEGINLDTAGVILMVVGVVGLLISLVLASSLAPTRRRDDRDGDVVRETETRTTREHEGS